MVTILELIETIIILAGTLSHDIQMSDEHSGGVKKRKGVEDCVTLLPVRFLVELTSSSNLHV
jgi:hypothetical protein